MCGPQDDPAAIEAELNKPANRDVVGLLSTPLMVALLVLHYRLSSEFPGTVQCFYGDLFEVLFKRHDQTKGYKRIRKSNASENELRDLFGYLCYAMRRKDAIEVERTEFLQECEQGVRFYGRAFDAPARLMILSGERILYWKMGLTADLHTSRSKKFYAARFLVAQTEGDVRKFLHARVRAWNTWRQFLEFTEILNKYLFCKHFLAPRKSDCLRR